jgi:hypothetical protein
VLNPAVSWPLTYRLAGNNPALAAEFSSLLHGCGFERVSGDEAVLTVLVSPQAEMSESLSGQSETIVEWRGLLVQRAADKISFRYRSWYLELHLPTRTFHCSGPAPDSSERLNFREFFLLSPLLFVMHRLGCFELHAGACAKQDDGYLLLGPAGSGKTTAMISLIQSGWSYLSDDAVVAGESAAGALFVRPLRRSFSLRHDLLQKHPELAPYAREAVPGTDKRRLDPREVWPGKFAAVAQPGFLIACTVGQQDSTTIIPIDKAAALARLVASTPWLMFDRATAARHLQVFRSLAMRCLSFELSAGRDLLLDRVRLASLLDPTRLRGLWKSVNAGVRMDVEWA